MSEPEIARRCPSCGMSIRVRASFCQQCGKTVTAKSNAHSVAKDAEALTPGSGTPEFTEDSAGSAASETLDSDKTVTSPTALSTSAFAPSKHPMQATVGMVHRAGLRPRQVSGEDELNRVEKFRHISSAVIDGAAYDPSLRFVLVAAVLFVLFLLLLLLSELIT